MSRALKAHILLILVTFAWGATFVLIKDALAHVSPLVFNSLRMVVAATALLIIFHRQMRSITQAASIAGIGIGVFLWLGYAFQTSGLRLTTPSKSAFITGFSVVLVPLIVAVGTRCLPSRWTLLGVFSALAGLYLMTIPAGEGLALWSINRGDLLTLCGAASFAMHIFVNGRVMRRYRYQQIATVQVMTAAVLMALSISVETPRLEWSANVAFAVLFTALICTAVAFAIQAWAQQFTPPTHTALIFSLEPVFAGLTSYVVLGERLGYRGTLGALLILGGIIVSELKGSAGEAGAAPEPHLPANL